MIQFVCSKCPAGYQISGTWFKIQELLVAHPRWQDHDKECPLCGGVLLLHSPRLNIRREWRRIDAEEFFRALCGFGLPEELGCNLEAVSALMQANLVVGIDMAEAGGDRTAVYAINLRNGPDGWKLHLVSSPEGPCIYKITRSQHGNSDSNHLPAKTTDIVIQRPHQGVPIAGAEANPGERTGDAGADINAENTGGITPADSTVQACSNLDAGNPLGTSAGRSSNSTSTQTTT